MTESDQAITPQMLLDKVNADESPEKIIVGLKGSRYGLLTFATAFS